MNIQKELQSIGLNQENCIVIGSGILNALNIRESNDIDVIVSNTSLEQFKNDESFIPATNHEKQVLTKGLFEIGTEWYILGRNRTLDNLMPDSEVIDNVRYIKLDLLLDIKKSWMQDPNPRQKDKKDITLIENYLQQNKLQNL